MKKILSVILSMIICIAILPVLAASAASVFDGGDGTVENPYLISTEAQLKVISDLPDMHYKLLNDITLTEEWIPIGTDGEDFSGTFDGDGKTIYNLSVKTSDYEYIGFFEITTETTVIKNLTINNSTTLGKNDTGYVGTIVAYNNGTIVNCHAVGDLYCKRNPTSFNKYGKSYVGGITAMNNGNISNSSHSGNIETASMSAKYYDYSNSKWRKYQINGRAGGIAGSNSGNIDRCYAKGTRTIILPSYGGTTVTHMSQDSDDFIGGKGYIGGIAGYNSSNISNCYFIGSCVAEHKYQTHCGGISGYGSSEAMSSYCYSSSTIKGGGSIYSIAKNYSNCYYDKEVSGLTDTAYGTPKSTLGMKMQTIYTNWDFDTIWAIDDEYNDGYPYLQWEYPSEPEPAPEPDSIVVEIVDVTATDNSLKFISEVGITGTPEIDSFGTTFIPLSLFDDESAKTAKVSYDNYDYNIQNGQTYGATLSDIPDSCKDWQFVGKSYVKDADRNYVWSVARSASINDTILNTIE